MKCPTCEERLDCKLSVRVGVDDRPGERAYQWWECTNCGARYFAIYEEDNVNIFNDKTESKGYRANADTWQKTLIWARQCPNPNDTTCKCIVHQEIPPATFVGEAAWYRND